MAELNIQMKNQAILQKVENLNQNVVDRILSDFPVLLTNVYDANGQNPVSFDVSSWNNSLTTDQRSTVCVNIIGKNYCDLYAFIAVKYMAQKGIVNGVGDRIFAPHSNLTRAQAAKMIYSIIIA